MWVFSRSHTSTIRAFSCWVSGVEQADVVAFGQALAVLAPSGTVHADLVAEPGAPSGTHRDQPGDRDLAAVAAAPPAPAPASWPAWPATSGSADSWHRKPLWTAKPARPTRRPACARRRRSYASRAAHGRPAGDRRRRPSRPPRPGAPPHDVPAPCHPSRHQLRTSAPADNVVHAGQAACWYSWMTPPALNPSHAGRRRSRRHT